LQLKANKTAILAQDYLKNLYRLNESHFFEVNNTQIKGSIKGVNANGKLIIQTDDDLIDLDLKEVKFIID
jgi:BirA family biotin operon repressor/biotin-[acetyl-CoA-carboxylase] ligase